MYLRLLIASFCVLTLTGQTTPPAPSTVPADSADIKPASVSGKTVTSTGQPIKKTILTLRWVGPIGSEQLISKPYSATSDVEGNFIFEAVDPGRYMLSADRPGYQRQTYGSRRPNGSGGTVLALTSGQTMSALNIVLAPQIVISGKVLDSDGDPVGRTQVRAMRSMFYNGKRQIVPTGSASTDENGEYKLQNLGPGKYYVSAGAPRDQFFGQGSRSAAATPPAGQPAKQEEALVTTYYPGVTDPTAATLIELVAGRDRPGTDITLRKSPVFHVRGKVAGQVSTDRSQFRVSVMPRSSIFMDFTTGASSAIAKDGTFDLSPVPSGSYSLILMNTMGMFKAFGSVPVEVGNQNVDDLTLTAEAPFDLSGQVKTEKVANAATGSKDKEKPTPGPTRISLDPVDGMAINVPNAVTKEDDTFVLTSVAPGRFRVNVYSLPEGSYVKAIRFGDQNVLEGGLTIPPGGGSTPLEITLGVNAATLAGSVENDGKPVPSVTVTLIPDPPAPDRRDLYKQSNTDQNGHFTVSSIAPGKYRVYAWNDLEQGNQFDPDFLKNYETKGTKLDIAESAAPQVTLNPIEH